MVKLSYLDTSAAMKLIIEESESQALLDALVMRTQIAASWLLHTELHCAAGRRPETIAVSAVQGVLNAVILVDPTRGDMVAAGTHAPLRSPDALHLAAAIRMGADEMITYNTELAQAAGAAGLAVVTPGR